MTFVTHRVCCSKSTIHCTDLLTCVQCTLNSHEQRIYIYIEFKATPLCLCSGDYCPRKQEQELQRNYRQHGELFLKGIESSMQVYTVGWIDFGLFLSNFIHLHVVCSSPRNNTGNHQISLTLVQKPMRGTTLKVPIKKNARGKI